MTTGNDERDNMLKRAIGECQMLREEPVIGLVIEKLPADFDLLPEELADALAEMKLAQPEPQQVATPEPTPASAPTQEPEVSIGREQSQRLVESAHTRLNTARINVRVATEALRETKGKLATAITGWQTSADPLTPAQRREREMRNHLAGEQAKRAARRAPSPQATAFVQKRMQNSGNRRGAFPRQYLGRTVKPSVV
jgi:hypothetical protein